MLKEVKQRWIEALRSGKYKQGKQAMIYGNQHAKRYCCLGVLREIEGIKPSQCQSGAFKYQALSYLGLDPLEEKTLIKMNDGIDQDPHNFNQIADWIEDNVNVKE